MTEATSGAGAMTADTDVPGAGDDANRPMRFAYADPPYLGYCKFYDHNHGDGDRPFDGLCWDDLETHRLFIEWMTAEFDGWAMSMTSGNLKEILPLCPDVRVLAWVKPFASFKPGVGVAYAWEPVVLCGGRRRTREQRTVRDWCAENITLRRGFTGAKPAPVLHWLCEVLNVRPGDEVEDIFHGSGAADEAIAGFLGRMPTTDDTLFGMPA